MKKIFFIILTLILILTGCDAGSKDLIEVIESPNGEYEIRTYLHNCGATCDFGVSADLCDKNNKCKEIYFSYHENISFVYWIDEENVFINQKTLNIFKDKYDSLDYDNAFRLFGNYDEYKAIYLINKDNEYKLTNTDISYIDEVSKSIFTFNKKNIYVDYDFIFKIINIKDNTSTEYLLKIDNNKMYMINNDKMSELNRTDYEYIKRILISKDLYSFN